MRTWEQLATDAEPFPDKFVKQVPPRNEDYVSWTHYAQRVLAVHGPHRYSVTSVVWGNGWAVSVRVQFADHEFYDGVGYDSEDATHAESQAYKRAMAKAGLGLHLYGDYWLPASLAKRTHPEPVRKKAADYKAAAAAHILEVLDGDEKEAALAWPLALEAAHVEKVTTKKEYEAVIDAANKEFGVGTLGGSDGAE